MGGLLEMEAEPGKHQKEAETSLCGICPGGCAVNVQLVDGKIEKISPIKGHPVGIVCVRGLHAKEIVYSNDRLKYPLLRVGKRGEGRFERISWDEAMDRIANTFQSIKQKYGPEALMSYFGRGSFDQSLMDVFGPRGVYIPGTYGVLFPFGSPTPPVVPQFASFLMVCLLL
jgi:anaerobic selenocysteine-containing dehydrogenase